MYPFPFYIYYMACCEYYLTCDIAFNTVMPLSRASTCRRYSRIEGVTKLLSKWEGPYVIEEVYRSGAIKINNFEGTNLKVVNGQRIKHYMSCNP